MTSVLIGAALAVVALLLVLGWERYRRRPTVDECCRCGQPLTQHQLHVVVERPTDKVEMDMGGWGGTFVSAAFCANDCPGGCHNRRCRAKQAA